MKSILNFNEFHDSFTNCNRENNFSYNGRKALFDYLEEYEDSTGSEIEHDVIALCCEYCEYENIKEYINYYSSDIDLDELKELYGDDKELLKEEHHKLLEEEISNKTTLIKLGDDLNDGFIIQSY